MKTPNPLRLRFRWESEDEPGELWRALLDRAWPAYRSWFLQEGASARPDLDVSRAALMQHMPELVPIWERLRHLADGDDEVARMLALYRPAPYVSGCTQAVRVGPSPVLVRNYDYHPHGCEGTVVRTQWLDTRVVASSDCLWGALDGINEHGLAVALSFGGSRQVGDGFGIPLILRYVLETCTSVEEALTVLRRVPCHMAYNVSLVDRSGEHAVAHLRPGAATEVVREAVATNHHRGVEWPEYARATQTLERKAAAEAALRETETEEELVSRFLKPPLFVTDYAKWHGTLYTVAYRPDECAAEFHWAGASVRQTVDDFTDQALQVPFYTTVRSGAS